MQLLRAEGVDQPDTWASIVMKLAYGAADSLSPSAVAGYGPMDPRFYIKVCACMRREAGVPWAWLRSGYHITWSWAGRCHPHSYYADLKYLVFAFSLN